MDMYGFYTGKIFNAYEYLGAHLSSSGTTFRVFAPNAQKICVIGDFTNWAEIEMPRIYDGNFYEIFIEEAKEGMRYKLRVYSKNGKFIDHCDPFGYGMELRPQNASIIRDMSKYSFHDNEWIKNRTDYSDKPLNIYEIHFGSWKMNGQIWYTYNELADKLVPYVKQNGYNAVELMPICEYPNDMSWGYQALGFYSPTSRYGTADDLKKFVDKCHVNGIAVILDFAPVHFAVDDFGLAEFDGTPLYEYPHKDIAYNEWGSKNFAHSRGEVRSFLQSSVMYWIKEYHFDGIRMDAISNMIYWQGNADRGINQGAVNFIQYMNKGIKSNFPDVMLIAEDSTAFPNVTKSVDDGGLGFDYKWDMGWMNDTLQYFKENSKDRIRDYHKLTFSMHYFYSEKFLLPFSHDEVVHGKATILQKMNGQYEEKFSQAKALYMYMYAHTGKKLNFMGNEIGQLREWDEKREQDWDLLKFPIHNSFHCFMTELNQFYLKSPAFYEMDYKKEGFIWTDCTNQYPAVYSFLRKSKTQTILVVLNFSDTDCEYEIALPTDSNVTLVMDSDWEKYGGRTEEKKNIIRTRKKRLKLFVKNMSGKYYLISNP